MTLDPTTAIAIAFAAVFVIGVIWWQERSRRG